ncbi:site-specific integrase [soil metagenome]
MPTVKLDATFCLIAHCEPGKKKTDYYDTGSVKGFVLEVRPNGGKTYYLRYQNDQGKQCQHKIASYGDISFAKAVKEAQRLRSQVVLGGDPLATKEEKRAIPLYSELAIQHLAHANTYQRSYDTTAMYVNNHIVPKWGKRRIDDITQQSVAQWLADKAAEGLAPATVEKIRAIFGRSFELARQWGMAGSEKNPARGITRKPINNARDRYLNAAEVKRLMEAVAASRNTQLKHIIGMLLLTGARVSELLKAEWKDVSVERKVWLIPTSKTGKARHVPLSQAAIDLIGTVPRFKNCPYLLPNPDTLKPFVTIKHGWQHARDEAKLPDLRIHDLRHSAASFMINAGIDLFAVGRVLGHADHKSTMRYSHLANDTLLAAVEAGAKKMQL